MKGTKEKGIIYKPDELKGTECYIDVDFARGYTNEKAEEQILLFSRTGYVIFYYTCPLIWVSKLQSEISLLTVEAEYVASS